MSVSAGHSTSYWPTCKTAVDGDAWCRRYSSPAHDSHTDTRAEVLKSLTQEQVFDYVTLCLLRHVCSWTFVIEEAEMILSFLQIFDELSTKDSF